MTFAAIWGGIVAFLKLLSTPAGQRLFLGIMDRIQNDPGFRTDLEKGVDDWTRSKTQKDDDDAIDEIDSSINDIRKP
jgi:hypothetical protein